MPDPAQVFCIVNLHRSVDGSETEVTVTQADLGLQPIDLLYILTDVTAPALAELDDRALWHAIQTHNPRPDAALRIEYTRKSSDLTRFTFFELMPLIASLRKIALISRPLKATDVMLPVEAQATDATERSTATRGDRHATRTARSWDWRLIRPRWSRCWMIWRRIAATC